MFRLLFISISIISLPDLAQASPMELAVGSWGISQMGGDEAAYAAYGCETNPTTISIDANAKTLTEHASDGRTTTAGISSIQVNTFDLSFDGNIYMQVFLNNDTFIRFPKSVVPTSKPPPPSGTEARRVVTAEFSVAALPWERCDSPSV